MVVAKHCDAVHWAGAGFAVVMLVARFATRVSLEENIASECDVLRVCGYCKAGSVVMLRCASSLIAKLRRRTRGGGGGAGTAT